MWHLETGEVLGAMQMCKSHSGDIAWLFTYQNVVKIKFLFQEYSMSFNSLHYALFFTLVSLKKAIQWLIILINLQYFHYFMLKRDTVRNFYVKFAIFWI